jgi:hypothetical protein
MSKKLLQSACAFTIAVGIAVPLSNAAATDIDPQALDVLKASIDLVAKAPSFSFRVKVARDRLASNNQILTYFNDDTVTVTRPDKIRMDVDGEHHDVDFYFDGSHATMIEPSTNLYVSLPAPKSIDAMLDDLEKRGVYVPLASVLTSDPYRELSDGLQTAYVIGRVDMYKKEFVQLAFTQDNADWQVWIENSKEPLLRRADIVYKKQPGSPRVTLEFYD